MIFIKIINYPQIFKIMNLIIKFCFLFFSLNSMIYSQEIKGVVIDKKTKETLIGANVQIINGSGVTTNVSGEFTFKNFPDLPITIQCSYIGYKTKKIEKIRQKNSTPSARTCIRERGCGSDVRCLFVGEG